jgi:hypothetical protein
MEPLRFGGAAEQASEQTQNKTLRPRAAPLFLDASAAATND